MLQNGDGERLSKNPEGSVNSTLGATCPSGFSTVILNWLLLLASFSLIAGWETGPLLQALGHAQQRIQGLIQEHPTPLHSCLSL
jgi:hypothetical protein